MKATTTISLLLAGIGATVIATSAPASAASFAFKNIVGGSTVGDAFANDFSFDVTDSGSGTVLFQFFNKAPSTQALKQVAFSVDSTVTSLLANMSLNQGNTGTVLFNSSTNNLSQSNLISGWDGTTFGGVTDGGNSKAVQSGESLGIKFNANYNDVIAAINAGTLKIGIHVGSLPSTTNETSDSYVNGVPTVTTSVPEPSIVLGAGLTFGLASFLKGNNNKKREQEKANA